MPLTKNIFRAYDIRGVYPAELDENAAYSIAKAYVKNFPDAKKIAVGGDFRISTPSIKNAVLNALAEEGKEIYNVSDGPTPIFRYSLVKADCDGGIMITASHNPKEYNGLKIMDKNAYDYTGESGIYKLYEIAKNITPLKSCFSVDIHQNDKTEEYIKTLTGIIHLKKTLKIILDTGNGACGEIPEKIFKKLGCEVMTLFKEPDGAFPNHTADPHSEENLKILQEKVLSEKADLGIAYDGDGDRMGVIDNLGRVISGYHILMMLSRQALAVKKGNIVFEARAANTLIEDTENRGGEVYISKAGRSYVIEEIVKRNAVFGGELTGHLFFPYCYYNFDDAILASLKITEIVSEYENFSSYINTLPEIFVSPEFAVKMPDEMKFQKIEEIKIYLKNEGYKINDLDGIKISFPSGSALVRASNTAPQIKIIYEGKTEEDKVKIGEKIKAILEKFEINLKI